MIRRLAILLFLLVAANSVVARTVVVRSGEHDGFTRLVLQIPEKVDWSFKQDGKRMMLTVDAPDIQFDTGGVFDRIPRTRLTGLKQGGPGTDLIFELGCDCDISDFVQNPGFLVIDIKDPKEPPAPYRQALILPTNQSPYRLPFTETAVASIPAEAPAPSPLPIVENHPEPLRPIALSPPESVGNAGLRKMVNASEERLLAQINRATDQGLLDLLRQPEGHATPSPISGHPEADTPDGVTHQVALSATTVIDRDLAAIAQRLHSGDSADKCLKSDLFALHEWGGDQAFDAEIGRWRSRLFEEFDRVNVDNVLGLARAYLHYGFGAEALQALSVMPEPKPQYATLTALAQLIDRGELTGANPFEGQQRCNGDVSLWAVIAADNLPDNVNAEAIQRAIARLPEHLRLHLGPQVSEKFSQAGDSELAASILRAVTRSGVETGSGIELAKAAVAQLHGDSETANQELENSVAAGTEHSPKALAKLVAAQLQSRGAIAPDLPDLAAAYAMEYRNGEAGSEMRQTHVVALALTGRFPDAFETLEDLTNRDGQTARTEALKPLIELLSERADDLTFLQFSLAVTSEQGPLLPESSRNSVARRLLDLGFSGQAANWLTGQDDRHTSRERRLLRAEVSLAAQLPHRAIVELLGLNGPEAARLRASAMMQNGDYQLAGQMLVAAEDFDAATRGFWLAEDWEAVPEHQGKGYGQVVETTLKLKLTDGTTADLPPLAQARDLMQNSYSVRADIANLLQFVEADTVSR
ncbi:MAG: hypothetical protein ACI8R4_000473 [Paracoccaceae bacterium]|jgi:hypothetical protein